MIWGILPLFFILSALFLEEETGLWILLGVVSVMAVVMVVRKEKKEK